MTTLSLTLDTPALAAHYENASVDRQFKAGKQLIEKLSVRAGERVLDVGAGTGLLAEHVAGIVGPSGSVTAVDPLPLRIEIAKSKVKPNLTFSVDDAYKLDAFADETFDVVYLNAVFHWFPEKKQPLQNFFRVLKRGGRLGLSTGDKDAPNRLHVVQQAVLSKAPYNEYLQPKTGLPHRVSADELRALLEQTGFKVKAIEKEAHSTLHASPEASVEHSQASSFGNLLGHLPEDLRARAESEILAELEQYRTPEGVRQEGVRLFAIAEKV